MILRVSPQALQDLPPNMFLRATITECLVGRSFGGSVGWLVGWLAGWLVGWLFVVYVVYVVYVV